MRERVRASERTLRSAPAAGQRAKPISFRPMANNEPRFIPLRTALIHVHRHTLCTIIRLVMAAGFSYKRGTEECVFLSGQECLSQFRLMSSLMAERGRESGRIHFGRGAGSRSCCTICFDVGAHTEETVEQFLY